MGKPEERKKRVGQGRNHGETPKELSKLKPVISDPSLRTDKE
jgi:hypothetical protein